MLSIGAARADNSCKDHESRLSDLEKRVAELEATSVPLIEIKACNDSKTDLRTVVKCRTSKGAIYERVARDNFGESWKGPDGLIWSDYVGSHSQFDAVGSCKTLGGTLPVRADFERGEAKGFREVLPNMKDRWFWSLSTRPYFSSVAYYFDGNDGAVSYDDRSAVRSVRCVAR